ncbi:Right handed beta helix region [Candidatus Gugararchaeum adminiculabundum]|nr:Right handed beta helix region [Candidatus Gugararchaeum adminiculabundum]
MIEYKKVAIFMCAIILFLSVSIGLSSLSSLFKNNSTLLSASLDAGGGSLSVTGCNTIVGSGVYTLTSDVSSSSNCFIISANDVILNCNGRSITGSSWTGIGINATSRRNVTVKNCAIKYFSTGIYYNAVNGSTIQNNSVYNNTNGVYLYNYSGYNNVINNSVYNGTYAITVYLYSSGNTIANNSLYNLYQDSILVQSYSYNNTITNNSLYILPPFTGGQIGIHFEGRGSNNTVVNNSIRGSSTGIYSNDNCNYNTFVYNDISNGYRGIWDFRYGSHNTYANNTIHGISTDGIQLAQTNNAGYITAVNNTVYNNTGSGIVVSSPYANVSGNLIQNNSLWDLFVSQPACSTSVVQNNIGTGGNPIAYYNSTQTISGGTYSELFLCNADSSVVEDVTITPSGPLKNNGLVLSYTNNTRLSRINATSTYAGIYFQYSNNNTIVDSYAYNNGYGIYLYYSSNNNTMVHNYVLNNTYGIYLSDGPAYNLITNNTLVNNGVVIQRWSHYNNVINNTVNGPSNGYGFYITGGGGYQINYNTLINNSAFNTQNGFVLSGLGTMAFNNTAYNNTKNGFWLNGPVNITLVNNTAYNNSNYGIWLQTSSDSNLTGNIAQDNTYWDLWVDGAAVCSSVIEGNTGSAGRPIGYFNSQTTRSDEVYSELILCNATGSVLENILINGSDIRTNNGLLLHYTNNSHLTNITSGWNYYGVYFAYSYYNLLENSRAMFDNLYGIYLIYSNNNTLSNNTAYNNTASGNGYGIILWISSNNVLNGNTAYYTLRAIGSGYRGIYLGSSSNNNTLANNIVYNAYSGIVLDNGQLNNTISNNLVYNNTYGIYLQGALNNTVANNTVYSGTQGIYLQGASNNSITNNTIYWNTQYGIQLYLRSNNNTVANNTLNGNRYEGILIYAFSNGNNITDNYVYNDTYSGIYIYNSSNNNVTNNFLYNNTAHGIWLDYFSTNNTLLNNTAYKNKQYGIYILNSNNTLATNTHLYNNTVDFVVNKTAILPSLNITSLSFNVRNLMVDCVYGNYTNYTSLSIIDTVENSTSFSIKWAGNSTSIPGNTTSFLQKFVNITANTTSVSIDYIALTWFDAEVPSQYNPAAFDLWKYNSSGWTMLNGTSNATSNTLALYSLFPGSTYAIIQYTGPPEWLESLSNRTAEVGSVFAYDVNATDLFPTTYTINDTTNFAINSSNGNLTNATYLPLGANYSLNITASGAFSNSISAVIRINVTDTTAPAWVETPVNKSIGSVSSFEYDLNATDNSGTVYYFVNDTGNFAMDINTGNLTNATSLSLGIYPLMVTINDSSNNPRTAQINATVLDTLTPVWAETPENQTAEVGFPFFYDLNATDNSGTVYYFVNDTGNFAMDINTGNLTNATTLAVGFYPLLVTVNDSSNNANIVQFNVTVLDTIAPTWNTVPINRAVALESVFSYVLDASDNSGTVYYFVNDTGNFTMDMNTGVLTNSTILGNGVYRISVTANDSSDNSITSQINITVGTVVTTIACGDILVLSTTLPFDLICNGTALTLRASNIILDCNGSALMGNGTGYGVNMTGQENTSIKNCMISGFASGINLQSSLNITVQNNSLHENGQSGLVLDSSSENTIIENSLYLNSIAGMSIFDSSLGNNITHNYFYLNALFSLYNGQAAGVNAQNNYWGTTYCSDVSATIHDWYDDSALGTVIFSPLLNATYPTGSSIDCESVISPDNNVPNNLTIHIPSKVCKGYAVEVKVSDKDGGRAGAVVLFQIGGFTETSGITGAQGKISFTPLTIESYTILARYSSLSAEETMTPVACLVPPCTSDSDCADDEKCLVGGCTRITGVCGKALGHAWTSYDCCSNLDCASDSVCTDNSCAVVSGTCGHAENHVWVPYECCADGDCASGEKCTSNACVPTSPEIAIEKEKTKKEIDKVKKQLDDAKNQGQVVTEAEKFLSQAYLAYQIGDYANASNLAEQASTYLLTPTPLPLVPEEHSLGIWELIRTVPGAITVTLLVAFMFVPVFLILMLLKRKKRKLEMGKEN